MYFCVGRHGPGLTGLDAGSVFGLRTINSVFKRVYILLRAGPCLCGPSQLHAVKLGVFFVMLRAILCLMMGNVPVGTVKRNPKLSHTPTTQSCSDATCLSGTPLSSCSTAGVYAKSVLGFSYGCRRAGERECELSWCLRSRSLMRLLPSTNWIVLTLSVLPLLFFFFVIFPRIMFFVQTLEITAMEHVKQVNTS